MYRATNDPETLAEFATWPTAGFEAPSQGRPAHPWPLGAELTPLAWDDDEDEAADDEEEEDDDFLPDDEDDEEEFDDDEDEDDLEDEDEV